MAANPKQVILGGDTGLAGNDSRSRGAFSTHPAAQLKYSTSWKNDKATIARMYLLLPIAEHDRMINSVPEEIREIVRSLLNEGYIDFLLTQVGEGSTEKMQVIHFLNDDHAGYFFGSEPVNFSASGYLYTTQQDDWWHKFTLLYEHVLKGTKLAEAGALVSLRYDSRYITGAIINFSTSITGDQQMAVPFSFSMLVKSRDMMPAVQRASVTEHTRVEADRYDFWNLDGLRNGAADIKVGAMSTTVLDSFVLKEDPKVKPPKDEGLSIDEYNARIGSYFR